MTDTILEMREITKRFPGIKALDRVNLRVKRGEIHALVGENGAGKSTLMNILSGVYAYGNYEGTILLDGQECIFKSIKDSERRGIAIIHQELASIPYLTIAENVFLGNERARRTVIDWNRTYRETAELLKRVRLTDDPHTLMKDLSVGKQQLVEIAKALSKEIRLLILDEPTAALNENDSQNLLSLLLELKSEGITSILISHKLSEVSQVADTITIIRDGAVIEMLDRHRDDIGEDRIIKGMVGRELTDRFPARNAQIGETRYEVRRWCAFDPADEDRQVLRDISFSVRRGEVVGFAGLMGAGRTELAMSLFGRAWGARVSGEVIKDGSPVKVNTIPQAIANGIAYVTEDRKNLGLILIDNILHNVSLPNLNRFSRATVIDRHREEADSKALCRQLNVKSTGMAQRTGNLSGGNQQKVVLAKWMMAEPDLLILDEPTRGIDVNAKYEIYGIINRLAESGKSIVLISSELPEILGMCDRIYVMNEGRIVGELSRGEASQESIMRCILRDSEAPKNTNQEG